MTEEIVRVNLGPRSYDVRIGRGLIERAGALIAPLARRVAIVTDETVAPLYLGALERSLAASGLAAQAILIPPGEAQKSFAGLERVANALLSHGLDRRDLVIALGGGVVGDLAGFAAGILKRGVDFVQIPTTLLAQVDSSVGGKTAIDTSHGKNLVGVFHQPRLVLADLDTLATLPAREMRCGYAEIVKYGLIGDEAFFAWCEENGRRVIAGDLDALAHAVKASVEAKARIVESDERDAGARALLNLGHTFAHAFEESAGFGDELKHGEAVAAGLALAFQLSARLGLCATAAADRVTRHLRGLGYAVDCEHVPGGPFKPDRLLAAMRQDKKTQGDELTFVLARAIGDAVIQRGVAPEAVRALISDAPAAEPR